MFICTLLHLLNSRAIAPVAKQFSTVSNLRASQLKSQTQFNRSLQCLTSERHSWGHRHSSTVPHSVWSQSVTAEVTDTVQPFPTVSDLRASQLKSQTQFKSSPQCQTSERHSWSHRHSSRVPHSVRPQSVTAEVTDTVQPFPTVTDLRASQLKSQTQFKTPFLSVRHVPPNWQLFVSHSPANAVTIKKGVKNI